MRSKKPRPRDVPFLVDVGIALAFVLALSFFILVMEDHFGVTGLDADQMEADSTVVVAHEPTPNKHN